MATYYVDPTNGSDRNAGTSAGAAFSSLAKVNSLSLQPGDTVLFARGGTWNGTLEVNASGTSGAAITYGAYGSGADPVFTGGQNGIDGNGKSNIVVHDIQIKNTSDVAIYVSGGNNWTFDHLTFDHTGSGYNGAAIQWWDGNNVVISNCTATNMTGDGLWIWNADGIKILNNTISVCQGDSADNLHMYAPRNYEIRGNYFSMQGPTTSGKGNIHSQAGSNGVVADNTLLGGNYGVGITDDNLLIQNNLIVDHKKAGWAAGILISEVYNISNIDIVGNTIKDSTIGIYSFQDYARNNVTIHNNIIDGFTRTGFLNEGPMNGSFSNNQVWGDSGVDLLQFNGWTSGSWTSSGNFFGPDQVGFQVYGSNYNSLSSYQSATGWDKTSSLLSQVPTGSAAGGSGSSSSGSSGTGTGGGSVNTPVPAVTINGTDNPDNLSGGAADQTITGGKGNDVLAGGGGHDTFVINAGDGTDTITDLMGFNVRPWVDPAGSDVIKFVGANMTAANMRLYQSNADVIVTFDGVANTQLTLKNVWTDALDNLAGSKYGFIFNGESGVTDSFDTLNWGTQAAQVWHANSVTFLTAQDNTISGLDNSNDVINGQDGNDVIAGLSGNDVLRGDSGNDTLTGGAGNDKLDGGSDYDVAVFAGAFSNYTIAKGANVTVKDLTGAEGTDTLVGIEKLQFADRAVLLDGTNNAPVAADDAATATERAMVTGNLLTNDSDIDGDALQAIAKTLLSDRGANVTIGADGSYSYDPRGSTELQALNTGQSVVDGFKYTLDDGHGGTATGTVKVTVTGVTDTVNNALVGTTGSETLTGNATDQVITGGKGSDVLTGGGGHDTFVINAGDGTDTITDFMGFNVRPWVDPAGSDVIKFVGANMTAANMHVFQANADLIITFDGVANTQLMLKNVWTDALDNLAGSKYGFIFNGESGVTDSFDTLNWGAQAAQVSHANSVTFLTAQNNTISGLENSNDVINGQDGNDVIAGLSGNDVLRGDSGNDTLDGGAGNDRLVGGTGADTLTGGADADVFVYARGWGQDKVMDFQGGVDKIDLSAFGLGNMSGLTQSTTMTSGANSLLIDFGAGDRLTVFGITKLATDHVIF